MESTPRACSRGLANPFEANSPLDTVTGTSNADPLRVTALDHEITDDSVKYQSVIKMFLDQRDEIIDRIRSNLRIQLCFHLLSILHFKRNNRIAHSMLLLSFRILSISRFDSRSAALSRLSWSFFPLHRPSSILIRLPLK